MVNVFKYLLEKLDKWEQKRTQKEDDEDYEWKCRMDIARLTVKHKWEKAGYKPKSLKEFNNECLRILPTIKNS